MDVATFDSFVSVTEVAGRTFIEEAAEHAMDMPNHILWTDDEWAGKVMMVDGTDTWAEFTRRAVAPFSPRFVAFVTDAYLSYDVDLQRRQSLGDAFAEGNPEVTEAFFVYASDGERSLAVCNPYKRVGDFIIWDKRTVQDDGDSEAAHDGHLPEAMRSCFEGEFDPWAGLAFLSRQHNPAVIQGPGIIGTPCDMERNGRCPCGSGKKAKVCHWR